MKETSRERRVSRKQFATGKDRTTRKNASGMTQVRGETFPSRSRSPSAHRDRRKPGERRPRSYSSSANRRRRRSRKMSDRRESSSDDAYRSSKRRRSRYRSKERKKDDDYRLQEDSRKRKNHRHFRRENRRSSSESETSVEGPRNVVVSYSDENSDGEYNNVRRNGKPDKSRRTGSKDDHDDTVGHYTGMCDSLSARVYLFPWG